MVKAVEPPSTENEPNMQIKPEVDRRTLKISKHSEDAVVPAQKGGRKLTFEEQLELYD